MRDDHFKLVDEIVTLEFGKLSCMFVNQTRLAELYEECDNQLINLNLYGVEERTCGQTTEKPYFTETDVHNIVMLMRQLVYSGRTHSDAIIRANEVAHLMMIEQNMKPSEAYFYASELLSVALHMLEEEEQVSTGELVV